MATQAEVKRFLESHPHYPKDPRTGEVRQQRVAEILTRSLYSGMVEAPAWGVAPRRGHHEALIDYETFCRVQKRLEEKAYAVSRKDTRPDFPLRGAVCCGDCGKPLSAGWSKGRFRKYPYYHCYNKVCGSYGKSIPRDRIEADFDEMLGRLKPTSGLVAATRILFRAEWERRLAQGAAGREALMDSLSRIEEQIETLLNRIVEASSETVVRACERKIHALEKDRFIAEERLAVAGRPRATFEESFELTLRFLANPRNLWRSGRFEDRQTVLKLVFCKGVSYCRNTGFRTAGITTPFKALELISGRKNRMVGLDDESLNSLFQEMARWNTLLKDTSLAARDEEGGRDI